MPVNPKTEAFYIGSSFCDLVNNEAPLLQYLLDSIKRRLHALLVDPANEEVVNILSVHNPIPTHQASGRPVFNAILRPKSGLSSGSL